MIMKMQPCEHSTLWCQTLQKFAFGTFVLLTKQEGLRFSVPENLDKNLIFFKKCIIEISKPSICLIVFINLV